MCFEEFLYVCLSELRCWEWMCVGRVRLAPPFRSSSPLLSPTQRKRGTCVVEGGFSWSLRVWGSRFFWCLHHSAKGASLPSQPLPGPFTNGPYGIAAPMLFMDIPLGIALPRVLWSGVLLRGRDFGYRFLASGVLPSISEFLLSQCCPFDDGAFYARG